MSDEVETRIGNHVFYGPKPTPEELEFLTEAAREADDLEQLAAPFLVMLQTARLQHRARAREQQDR